MFQAILQALSQPAFCSMILVGQIVEQFVERTKFVERTSLLNN